MGKRFVDKLKGINEKDLSVDKIVNIILYSVIIIMPFLVTKNYNSPYLGAKLLFMYIAGFILVCAAILSKKAVFSMYKEKFIIICYFISLIISTIFAIEPNTALMGLQDRGEGLITFVIYFLLFLMSARYLKITEIRMKVVMVAASLMGVYCILQFYGLDIFKSVVNHKIMATGITGLIGHKNFVATYLVIFLTAGFVMFIFYGRKTYFITSMIIYYALICNQTRGCWITFMVAAAVLLLFIWKDKKYIKRFISLAICFVLIFSFINVTTGGNTMERFLSIEDALDMSSREAVNSMASTRGAMWIITIKSLKKHPIMGAGLDCLQYRLNRDVFAEHTQFIKSHGAIIDKAHNEFLEVWACGGLFSLIIYLILLLVIYINVFKMIRNKTLSRKAIILILCITAYIIQSMANISIVSAASIYWIMLGAMVKEYRDKKNFKVKE